MGDFTRSRSGRNRWTFIRLGGASSFAHVGDTRDLLRQLSSSFRQNSASDCLCSRLDLARGLYSATHFSSASRFRGLYLGHTLVDVHPTNWAR
jgi:hypothetical protein